MGDPVLATLGVAMTRGGGWGNRTVDSELDGGIPQCQDGEPT